MISTFEILVLLLGVIAAVEAIATRIQIPAAILLVLAGVVLALIPGLPSIELAPQAVLLLVLPPVVYFSAFSMSWREFRFNLRPITMLAVGCVIFTSAGVAAAAHWFLGLAWPQGFLLGAIVSPPDTVAPLSIARRLQIPRRILVILEGEGLANDATALILYRFAVAAVSTGVFSFGTAAGLFAAIIVGEIAWGMCVGWLMLRLRRVAGDPRVEITLSVLTPFLAYWPPEHLGGSGVLATVTTGLYVSWNGLWLISAATRLQGIFFWSFFIYLIEGMIFLVTGLQGRSLILRIADHSIVSLTVSAALISAVVILTRFLWMYPEAYLSRLLIPALKRKDPWPPWQWLFAQAFTGIRGIVSLAAALAIPLTSAGGTPFPGRDLILFLTFSVILVTLVGQGLLLPAVIHALGLAHAGRLERRADAREEHEARRLGIETAIERLDALAREHSLADDILAPLKAQYHDRLKHLDNRRDDPEGGGKCAQLRDGIELLLIAAERRRVNELSRGGLLKDEARRRIERELDLREAHLANQRPVE